MPECLLGLGSNLGDRIANLRAALAALAGHAEVTLLRQSSCFESAPVGGPAEQRNYYNSAAVIATDQSPQQLVASLLALERRLGRVRGDCWGPRTIDLDLLLYADMVSESEIARVPHPRFTERRFALAPAAQVAGDWIHAPTKKTVAALLSALGPATAGELGLEVVLGPPAVQQRTLALRESGRRIGLVPTMGALHAGHLSLVKAARKRSDFVVATIFVNPTQFGPHEDLSRYPRTLDEDLDALSAAGCHLAFVPDADAMYRDGCSTFVDPPAVSQPLEGVCRPGHFRGVATIVLKLFHLIPAHSAYFGQKDYQQFQVIRHMIQDLDVPIEIVPCPIVREPDGLAMSSRNRYLSSSEREQALALWRALGRAEELVTAGERDAGTIAGAMREVLREARIDRIDYIAIADPETLADKPLLDGPAIALIAAHVGTTRLIDNQLLQPRR